MDDERNLTVEWSRSRRERTVPTQEDERRGKSQLWLRQLHESNAPGYLFLMCASSNQDLRLDHGGTCTPMNDACLSCK